MDDEIKRFNECYDAMMEAIYANPPMARSAYLERMVFALKNQLIDADVEPEDKFYARTGLQAIREYEKKIHDN